MIIAIRRRPQVEMMMIAVAPAERCARPTNRAGSTSLSMISRVGEGEGRSVEDDVDCMFLVEKSLLVRWLMVVVSFSCVAASDSLKQNTSNICVTGARHITKPVWFRPQLDMAVLRGMTARCSSIHPNLHVCKPLVRASSTCAFEAMLTLRDEQSLRASDALKA